MRQIILILITAISLFIGSVTPVSAQYGFPNKSDCDLLKTRTVIVELKDPKTEKDAKINKVLTDAFRDFWTLTKVEFLESEEFNQILNSGDTNYAALLPFSGENVLTMQKVSQQWGNVVHEKSFHFEHFDLSLCLIKGPNKYKHVCTITFANENILESDYLFAVQQISRLVDASVKQMPGAEYYDHTKNMEFIQTKTLLIPKELFKEKELGKIGNKYDYPFKIVSLDEMNDIVLQKDEKYIYPKIIWCAQHRAYGWITISAKDGRTTSIMTFGKVMTGSYQTANEVIKVNHLKYITSKMAQGINNKYD